MENPKSGHHGPEENARDGWDDTFGAFGVAGGDRALALRVARLERARANALAHLGRTLAVGT